ncbi:MAG: molybdopterin-containing oxidoreductase family protein [Anaerolineae bacterium]
MIVHEMPVSCNKDCGGCCPLWARVVDGKLVSIHDNPHRGEFMHGCVRGYQAGRLLYAPDRLTKPLLRDGPRGSGQFRPVSWDEALDRTAEGLASVYQRYGPTAMLNLAGYGSSQGAVHNTSLTTSRFLAMMGGYTYLTGSYSRDASNYANPYVLGPGAPEGMDAGALVDSRFIILWGADFYVNRFGCEWEERLKQAHERGVPILGIDPRRNTTIKLLKAEWLPILPSTDAALMEAMLYVLITENLVDTAFIATHTVGYEALRASILGTNGTPPKTPAWAAPLTGISADKIIELTRRYASLKPAALLPGLSIQRSVGGEETSRLCIALQTIAGNSGLPGGTTGADIWSKLPGPHLKRLPVPTPPKSASFPSLHWPDAILGGKAAGYPADIRAIYNVGGNFIVQGSDMRKSIRAFESVDFSVCHDWFLTPTACYCDIVLPASMPLEREDAVVTSINMLLYSRQAVEPLPEVRDDYDIFSSLAERLGFAERYTEGRSAAEWLEFCLAHSDVTDIEAFKRTGIYMGSEHKRVGLQAFRDDPITNPLRTPSGKMSSESYSRTGFPAVPTSNLLAPDSAFPLNLVTPVSRYRTHSQASNVSWFRRHEKGGLWLNPKDAVERGIAQGQTVEVYNAQGRMRIACRITDDIMPGVVCLLHGVWPEFDRNGVETAGSANILTTTDGTLPSHSSRTHSIQVQVKSAE